MRGTYYSRIHNTFIYIVHYIKQKHTYLYTYLENEIETTNIVFYSIHNIQQMPSDLNVDRKSIGTNRKCKRQTENDRKFFIIY